MKYILLFAALWCNSAKVTAQTAYIASYHFIKPYDTAAFTDTPPVSAFADAGSVPGNGKRCIKYRDTDTTSFARNLRRTIGKIFLNNCTLEVYCAREYCLMGMKDATYTEIGGSHIDFKIHPENNKTAINIDAHREALFIDNKRANCRPIKDNLHFAATGKHEKIGNWSCDEYVSADDAYKGLSVWACPDLATYIHPGFQGSEIKGGVVALQYGNDKLVLSDLKVATASDVPAIEMNWHPTERKKLDLFKIGAAEMVMR